MVSQGVPTIVLSVSTLASSEKLNLFMVENRKLLILTKYSQLAASSRLRMYQYASFLSASGWQVDSQALLSDNYLRNFFQGNGRSVMLGIGLILRRFMYLLKKNPSKYAVVLVHAEMLPYFPFFVEKQFLAGARVVVDYDDALSVQYKNYRFLRNKIADITRSATEVIVGSEVLRSYALQYNSRVTLIPTVVDLDRYQPKLTFVTKKQVVIGWIGTSATTRYLVTFASALQALAKKRSILLRCVGAHPGFKVPGVPTEVVSWSEAREAELVQGFDIGIMPLDNDEFSRGKCGYKILQYMACAVPTVASAVGANADIIQDEVNGLLAASIDEFLKKMEMLTDCEALRRRIGLNGRLTVAKYYCLEVRKRQFLEVVSRAATSRSVVGVQGL